MTLACVGDTSVTLVTFADAADARLEPAWDVMTAANSCPSCSRLIRLAAGVFGLKKAVQLATMTDWAEELEDDACGEAVFGAELVLVLLLQAPRPAPRAQARRIPDSALRAFI